MGAIFLAENKAKSRCYNPVVAGKERLSFSGFYKRTVSERVNLVAQEAGLTNDEIKSLENGLDIQKANLIVENIIGKYELPLGIATNFVIDGVEKLIPMVIEEASVEAGAHAYAGEKIAYSTLDIRVIFGLNGSYDPKNICPYFC